MQGFTETKHCRTEQQRQEHGIGLALVACARDSGMIARIGRRLKLHWGTRSKKPGEEKGRPFAFDQAIDRRAKFNADVALQSTPLKPGDAVLSHGDLCELARFVWPSQPPLALGCVLTFRDAESGAEEEKTYTSMFGNQTGSARLQRPPPTLAPASRETKGDEARKERRRLIREHACEVCATSPNKRDQKRRHAGPRVWVTRAALILLMPIYAMYAQFEAKHPGLVKESQYRADFADVCWEAIHAYREGCLCKVCPLN